MQVTKRVAVLMVLCFVLMISTGLFGEDFQPVADTHVQCSGTYDNYGGDEYIYIRQVSETGGPAYNRHGYIKFDISSYTGSIDTARLHLNVLRATTTRNETPVTAHFWLLDDGDDGWGEMDLTWASAPAKWDSTNNQIAWANNSGTSLFFFIFGFHEEDDPDTTYVFDVTDAVAADANGIISFFIADTSYNKTKIYLHTKENTVGSTPAILEIKEAGATSVDSEPNMLSSFLLYQNYPNPFNPKTTIDFSLRQDTHLSMKIYDMLGNHVKTIVDKTMNAGNHSVVWNSTDMCDNPVPAGVYFCQMTGNNNTKVIKMVLIK